MSEAKVNFSDLEIEARELHSPVWKRAEVLQINKYWSGADAEAGRRSEARLLWTQGSLLLRFDCKQSETLIINDKPFLTKKTIGLWEKDVCEAFIAPDPQVPEKYMEFEVAPTGEWLDLIVHKVEGKFEKDWTYASKMTCAAEIGLKSVIIAMRIPWKAFGKIPENGEKWRGNLFRQIGNGKTRGYLTWQPTLTPEPHFHAPEAFGWFEFVK
jgi:Carbohydrate family 9 binding domain-like